MSELENIFPVFNRIINKRDKELLLKQKAKVLWMTGLSGAGKTSLGIALEKELYNKGFLTQILDGDNIRSGINKNLKFTTEDRLENIRRIAEVSKLFVNCGIIAINCFITPTENIRKIAREIIGAEHIIEIFVDAPISVCEKRDVKGLYKKARKGEIKNFTGIDSPFEFPEKAEIIVKTDKLDIKETVAYIMEKIIDKISF